MDWETHLMDAANTNSPQQLARRITLWLFNMASPYSLDEMYGRRGKLTVLRDIAAMTLRHSRHRPAWTDIRRACRCRSHNSCVAGARRAQKRLAENDPTYVSHAEILVTYLRRH